MKKNRIKLTESQLHKVIKESVRKMLKEAYANEQSDSWRSEDIANAIKLIRTDLEKYSGENSREAIKCIQYLDEIKKFILKMYLDRLDNEPHLYYGVDDEDERRNAIIMQFR